MPQTLSRFPVGRQLAIGLHVQKRLILAMWRAGSSSWRWAEGPVRRAAGHGRATQVRNGTDLLRG